MKLDTDFHLVALLLYVVLAFIATAPAWLAADRLIGGGDQPDWTGTMWAYWWTGHAFLSGLNPFDGTHNFAPLGVTPVAQYNLLDALLFWPLLAVFGPRIGYDLAAIATLVSSAWGGGVLARVAGARGLGVVSRRSSQRWLQRSSARTRPPEEGASRWSF